MNVRRHIFERIYRTAPEVESLPWHRPEPHDLLKQAIGSATTTGLALDLGCGEGVISTYLAKIGFSVVGLDFVSAALAAARLEAERATVDVELVRADVLDYRPTAPFDLVVASGCLHHIPKRKHARYRSRRYKWLAPGGSYVLVHFNNRPAVGWIPKVAGHLRRQQVEALFRELHLEAYDETHYEVPLPMGSMRAGVYWFSRPAASQARVLPGSRAARPHPSGPGPEFTPNVHLVLTAFFSGLEKIFPYRRAIRVRQLFEG